MTEEKSKIWEECHICGRPILKAALLKKSLFPTVLNID